MRTLFGDFVMGLFDGPYWNATMPQYLGTADGTYQSSVDITTLLTLTPSATAVPIATAIALRREVVPGRES